MELILLISVFLIGFSLGSWYTLRAVKKVLTKSILENAEVVELPELITEQVNDSLFLYHNDNFICQGKTIDELAQNFLEIKKIKMALVQHEKKHIWFVEGKVVQSLETV